MDITAAQLKKLAPTSNAKVVASLVGPLNKWLPKYGINTPTRVAHFLAQAAEESDHFKTLHEYASGKEYEGRRDLGNTHVGDGVRYKGRGIFQLTGRANYREFGQKLGLDLEGNPELAVDPEVCVRTACEFWKKKGLGTLADADNVTEITRRINGGHNGLDERKRLLAAAKKIFTDTVPVARMVAEPVAPEEAETDEAEPDDTKPHAAAPDAPKTGITEGAKLGFGATILGILSQAWETLTQAPDTILQAVIGMASKPAFWLFVLVGAAVGYVWYRRNHMKKA